MIVSELERGLVTIHYFGKSGPTQVISFNGKTYGVFDDGLYIMDSGDGYLNSVIELPEIDTARIGRSTRPCYLYFDGKITQASVLFDDYSYDVYPSDEESRVILGKGMKERFWKIKILAYGQFSIRSMRIDSFVTVKRR
jgi:hypothetical protein